MRNGVSILPLVLLNHWNSKTVNLLLAGLIIWKVLLSTACMLHSNYKSDIIKSVTSAYSHVSFILHPVHTLLPCSDWLNRLSRLWNVYAWAAGIRHLGFYSSGNRRLWLDRSVHWRLSFNSMPMPWYNRSIHLLGSSDTKALGCV